MGIIKGFLKGLQESNRSSDCKKRYRKKRKYLRRGWLKMPLTEKEIEALDRYLKVENGLNYHIIARILDIKKSGNTNWKVTKRMERIMARFIFQALVK